MRPLHPGDRGIVEAGFAQLGEATIRARFLGPVKASPRLFDWVDQLDGRDRIAVGAFHAESGAPLGVARLVRDPSQPARAEAAVTVIDAWQRRGVGGALVAALAGVAAQVGVATLVATSRAQNRAARALARRLGPVRFGPPCRGVVDLEVPIVRDTAPRRRPPRRRRALAAIAAAAALLVLCSPALARTIHPNTTADRVANDGRCSLREAVTAARARARSGTKAGECRAGQGHDTIALGPGRFVLSRRTPANDDQNVAGDLDVRSPLTLAGAGAAKTIVDAQHIDRVIEVGDGASVTVARLTITGGRAPAPKGAPGAAGGGIFNHGAGTLTLRGSVVTRNRAGAGATGDVAIGENGADGFNDLEDGQPGGDAQAAPGMFGGSGGGIASDGPLVVERTTISRNAAGTGGAGGQAAGGNGGNGGGVEIEAGDAGAGGDGTGGPGGPGGTGGGIDARAQLKLLDSTVTLNASGDGGAGGIAAGGGGGKGGSGVVRQTPGADGGNARGGSGGPGGVGGGVNAEGTASVRRSTIDHNRTGTGGAGQLGFAGSGGDGGHGIAPVVAAGGAGGSARGGKGGLGGSVAGLNLVAQASVLNTTIFGQTAGRGGKGGDATAGEGGDGSTGGAGGVAKSGAGGDGGGSVALLGLDPKLTVTHVTVSGNAVGAGGGHGRAFPGAGGTPDGPSGATTTGADGAKGQFAGLDGTPRLVNSIVASNGGANCAPSVVGGGHDVTFGDGSCPGTNADPQLGSLRHNGGPTRTQSIGSGSAARDLVPAHGALCPGSDQRRVARPRGPRCDAGAFER